MKKRNEIGLETVRTGTDEQSVSGTSVRALQEREMLLRRLARVAEATGDTDQARIGRQQADEVRAERERLVRRTVEEPRSD